MTNLLSYTHGLLDRLPATAERVRELRVLIVSLVALQGPTKALQRDELTLGSWHTRGNKYCDNMVRSARAARLLAEAHPGGNNILSEITAFF